MSTVSETSFYEREARFISWSGPAAGRGSQDVPYDITTFISTAIERGVDFVPITRMAGLKALGEGATAHVAQSMINLELSFALKYIQFPHSDNPNEADIIRVALVELLALTHPQVKNHPNILALECASWDFSDSRRPVRPILVIEKSALGDLGSFFSRFGNEVTPENRVEICADIINAVGCLHANGIIHGDIKPENILIFRRAEGEYYAKLCDFGYSSLVTNEKDVTSIDLPMSTPWNAPELVGSRFGLSIQEAKRTDIYSAGLVCLWLLLGKGPAQLAGNSWELGYGFIDELKQNDSISEFVALNLQELLGVDEEMKSNLQAFFRLTTAEEVEKRIPALAKFIENPPSSMVSPIHPILPVFSMRRAFGELIQHDFLIRRQVVTCLQSQAITMGYAHRLDAAFQLAICYRLRFGGPLGNNNVDDWLIFADRTVDELEAEIEAIRTRDTIENPHYGNQLFEILMENGALLGQLEDVPSGDHFLEEHEKEIGCSHELEAMKHVLTLDESIALKRSIARAIQSQGRYGQARIILSDAFQTLDTGSSSGLGNPLALSLASETTTLLRLEGQVNEALALGTHVLSTRERLLSREDLRVSYARKALASIYVQKGSYDGAEILLRQALEAEKGVLDTVHPVYLETRNSLGIVLTELNRYEDASNVWMEVVGGLKDTVTIEHPLSLSAIGNVATWLNNTGNYFGSERMYRMQLAGTVSWAGPNHPVVALIMSNLAIVIKNQDRYDEAEEYARKAYEMNKDILGPEHHQTLIFLNNLAAILVRLEKYDQAETMLSMVASKFNEILGPYHADTLSAQLNLAKVFREQERLDESKSLQMKVIASYERSPCEDRSLIVLAKSQYAATLYHLGDYDAFIGSYRAALEAQKVLIGEEHPDTWITMGNLAAVLHEEGQPEAQWSEAEELHKFVVNRSTDKFGERHTQTLASIYWLAVLWVKMGKVEEALTILARTHLLFKEVLGEDNEWTRIVWRTLNPP